ncbi:MAG: hypothetical protein QM790_18370 [Nibricoccus sp.]
MQAFLLCGYADGVKPSLDLFEINMKTLLRGVGILLLLFVVLYVGMSNTHSIDFYFPVLSAKKVSQPAAIIFFGLFAIGLLTGIMLSGGSGGGSSPSESRKKK